MLLSGCRVGLFVSRVGLGFVYKPLGFVLGLLVYWLCRIGSKFFAQGLCRIRSRLIYLR